MSAQLREMPEVPFPLVGGFGQDLRSQVNPEITYNMYISVGSAKDAVPVLLPTPGMRPILNFQSGAKGRAQFTYKNQEHMYCVVSQHVYRFDSSLNFTIIGNLSTKTGNVSIIANNANQVLFVDGVGGWVYTETTGVWTDISSVENFPAGCISLGYLDGYGIGFYGDSRQFGLSEINDFLTWPLANIGNISRKAGTGVAVGVIKGLVLFMGTTSTETWFNSGGALFPFSRDNNALYEYGCAAPGSVAEGFDRLFWLARDINGVGGVRLTNGGPPLKISTYEVDRQIGEISDPSDATGQIFKKDGHIFYQLSFTSGNITFLFDYTTFEKTQDLSLCWSLLGESDFDTDFQDHGSRHLMQSVAYFNNNHYTLSYSSGQLFILDSDYYQYDANNILRMRITKCFTHPALKVLRMAMIELLVIRGVGLQNGNDANPTIEMQVSFDRATTWTKARQANLGKIGKSHGQTIFYEMGIAQSFVFMFKCWNAVDSVIMGGSMKYAVVSP